MRPGRVQVGGAKRQERGQREGAGKDHFFAAHRRCDAKSAMGEEGEDRGLNLQDERYS